MEKLDDIKLVHLAEKHVAELNKFELPDEPIPPIQTLCY